LLAIFGFHHRSDGKVKFGKCEIALHKETTIGLGIGKPAKSSTAETKHGENTMKTRNRNTKKKNDKVTWKALVAFLCMVPLVRRAAGPLTGMTSLPM
jgi:hypothetical protein